MHGWIYGALVKATAGVFVMLLRWIYLIDKDQRTVRKCVTAYQRWVLEKALMLQTLSGPPQIYIKSHWLFRRVSLCACGVFFTCFFFFFCYIDLRADLMVHQSLTGANLPSVLWPEHRKIAFKGVKETENTEKLAGIHTCWWERLKRESPNTHIRSIYSKVFISMLPWSVTDGNIVWILIGWRAGQVSGPVCCLTLTNSF